MSYNLDAQVFETQIVIENTTQPAGVTSGSIINKGSLSTLDTYVTGHTVVNNVRITPNLNDIIFEQQATLTNNRNTYTDITDFYFDDSICNSFKAMINVTVSDTDAKHAVWEINGLYKPSGWVITSSFTGDLTGIQFSIVNKEGGIGQIQYINSNTSGTTIIRYRARTTAPPGTTPLGVSTGVIANTSGPFIANNLVYANTTDTLATTDIIYNSNVLKIGGASRIVGENGTSFTNFSNGGAITSMGDASVAKKMIVGQKIGIATTAPGYTLDVAGDINFTGTFYKNNNVYSGSEIWNTNGNDVFYTTGNLGVGTTSPSKTLDVVGSAIISDSITTGNIKVNNINSTNISSGTLNLSTGITAGSAKITNADVTTATVGTLVNTDTITTNISAGTVHLSTGITASSAKITNADVTTATVGTLVNTNSISTNVSSGTLNLSTGLTAGSARITNADVTTISAATLVNTNAVATNVSAGTIHLSSGITAGSAKITNADVTTATVGTLVNTDTITTNISAGTVHLSTGITAGSAKITNANITSITASGAHITNADVTTATVGTLVNTNSVATNISSGTLNLSTGITAGSAKITNVNATTISAGTLVGTIITGGSLSLSGDIIIGGTLTTVNITTTNMTDTNITSGNINVTSLATINNATVTTATVATLLTTDVISTNVSAGTMNLSTGITAGSARITNANLTTATVGTLVNTNATVTTATVGTLLNTNTVSTNVSAGTMNLSTGITAGSAKITNANITNVTSGDAKITNLSSTNSSIGSFVSGAGTVGGHLVPSANITYDLGSATQRWKDIYLSGNTIYLGDKQLSLAGDTFELENISVISTKEATSTTSAALVVSGGVGIRGKLRVAGTSYIDTAEITTITASNIVASNVSSATFVASTGITTGTISASGLSALANVTATNASVGGLNASIGLTAASALITNNLLALGNSNTIGSIFTTAGNVGIGTTAPTVALDIINTVSQSSRPFLRLGNVAGGAGNQVGIKLSPYTTRAGGDTSQIIAVDDGNASSHLLFYTAATGGASTSTERMRITNSGNVGIGTNNPEYKLQSSSTISIKPSSSGEARYHLYNAGGTAEWMFGQKSSSRHDFTITKSVSGAESDYFCVRDSGSIGIGTTSPGATLDVVGTARFTTSVTSGGLFATNVTATNIVATTISAGTLVGTTITGGNLSLSGNLIVAGTLTTVNITSTNILNTNISIGTISATGLSSLANVTATNSSVGGLNASGLSALANVTATNASVGVLVASTGITTGTISASGLSALANVTATNASVGGLNASGLSALANVTATNASVGVLVASTGISTGTINATGLSALANVTATNASVGGLNASGLSALANVTATNASVGVLIASTGITAASAQITNIVGTAVSAGTVRITGPGGSGTNGSVLITGVDSFGHSLYVASVESQKRLAFNNTGSVGNIFAYDYGGLVAQNIALQAYGGNVGVGTTSPATTLDVSGTFRATTSITTGLLNATNVTSTNIVGTTISAGTILGTSLVSSANIAASLITAGTLVATTSVTSGALYATNVTATNMVGTALSTGTLTATTSVSSAALFATNVTATNVVGTTVSAGTLEATLVDISTTSNAPMNIASTYSAGANGYAHSIKSYNVNMAANEVVSNNIGRSSTTRNEAYFGYCHVTSGSTSNYATIGLNGVDRILNINGSGNVGIGTTSPATTLDVSGTFRATTSVTSAALYATNVTATNIVGTTISAGTIVGTTLISSANISASLITTGTLRSSSIILSGSSAQVSTYPLTNGLENGIAYFNNTLASADTTRWVVGLNVQTGVGNYGFWNSSLGRPALMMTSTGNVGIGTTSPATTLDVSGTFRATTSVTSAALYATNVTATNIVGTTISAGTLLATTITGSNLSLSGNLVVGGTLTTVNITTTNVVDTNISAGTLTGTNINATTISAGTLLATTITGSNLSLSGNITIGTLLATTRVSSANLNASAISSGTIVVAGGILASSNTSISAQGIHLQWNRSSADGESWIINQKGGGANPGIRFGASTSSNVVTELMRIQDTGNVGIGTGSPESKLHVNGAITIEGETVSNAQIDSSNLNQTYISFKHNGSSNDWAYLRQIGSSNNYLMALDIHDDGDEPGFCIRSIASTASPDTVNERFRVQANGNVGIGTSSPSYKLHVSGDIYATGDISAFSDIRLKSNVRSITDSLDRISRLRGVYYTHTETQKESVGLIAQETLSVLPEVVATKGEYLGINYGNIVGLLIEGIKEMQNKIDTLEAKINNL